MSLPAARPDDIQRVVDLVVAEVSPLRVVLFGSHARGDHRDGSDVDLMVLMPEGSQRLDVAQCLYRMMARQRDLRIAVDFVVTTPNRYEQAQQGFGLVYRDIAHEGHEMYAA